MCQLSRSNTTSMAVFHASGMNMGTLLFGVILGLLAVVHSTPSNIVVQDDVYREAVTDGYLIDNFFLNSLTTESSERPGAFQPSQQPMVNSTESDIIEGSGATDNGFETSVRLHHGVEHTTTTQSVSHVQSSQQPPSDSSETDMIEGSGDPNDKFVKTVFYQHSGEHHGTTPQSSISSVFPGDIIGSGSGDGEIVDHSTGSTMTPIPNTETSTASSDSTPVLNRGIAPRVMTKATEGLGIAVLVQNPEQVKEPEQGPAPSPRAGQSTPSWIIILAFIVGVAALIMVCVAIATRDKWNAPSQAVQSETKKNQIDLQKDVEMETFLQKDQPRENGQLPEYTVIPLDELPDNYSSD